jgi:hypothetical protein
MEDWANENRHIWETIRLIWPETEWRGLAQFADVEARI